MEMMERFAHRRPSIPPPSDPIGYALAGLGPIVVAALLVPLRNEIDTTNLALVLVVVVVLAAVVGGRGPAVVAAIVTTASFDFFLTRPYQSLSIESADDVETAVILLVIGLLVGQLVVWARRNQYAAARGADEVERLARVAELAASGAQVEVLVHSIETEMTDLLHLRSCAFEPVPVDPSLPRLERSGAITGGAKRRFVGGEFALPEEGATLAVVARGREVGRFVLHPEPTEGASLEERVVAVALSDLLGAALAADPWPVAEEG
jgi:Domain of unknown function (DUF4118)